MLYTISSETALVIALSDGVRVRSVVGGAVVGILTMALFWYFAWRGHRWPRWALLFLVIVAIVSLVSFMDPRSLLAILDVSALVLLLRAWPTFGHAS